MRALITGGTGFLLGHVARSWLAAHPGARATLLADAPPDDAFRDFLGETAARADFAPGDVRRPEAWAGAVDPGAVDILVHGAAIAPMNTDAAMTAERAALARTVDVNVMGTVAVMEWARTLPRLRRVVYVSSGVYGYGRRAAPDAPPEPAIEETAPLLPEDATYDITKAAGEWLVRRYAELFGIDAVSVRPSAIFGPMDRDTAGRQAHVAPWHMARAALAGRAFRVADRRAGYDWLYAPDAARAIAGLMDAARPRHAVYNVSYGRPASLAELAEGVRRVLPDFRLEEGGAPDFDQPADRRGGVWNVRSCRRLEAEFGWRPTPLAEAMADYVGWLRDHDDAPAPPPAAEVRACAGAAGVLNRRDTISGGSP